MSKRLERTERRVPEFDEVVGINASDRRRGRRALLDAVRATARGAGVADDVLYALARRGVAFDWRGRSLRRVSRAAAARALEEATDRGIVRARSAKETKAIVDRFVAWQAAKIGWHPDDVAPRRLAGRVVDEAGDRVTDASVVVHPAGSRLPVSTVVDTRGEFAVEWDEPVTTASTRRATPVSVSVSVSVSVTVTRRGGRGHRSEIAVGDAVKIVVPAERVADPGGLARLGELIPGDGERLVRSLRRRGVRDLAGLRERGGAASLDKLPGGAGDPSVAAIDAHARLAVLSDDAAVRSALLDRGFRDESTIARAPRAAFVKATRGKLGDFGAARVHAAARAQTRFVDHVLSGLKSEASRDKAALIPGATAMPSLFPVVCGCEDCEAAVSPLAYLADLLEYALSHLEVAGTPLTLAKLTKRLHQQFASLPASCEQMDATVRQVRIAVEVLRRYLDEENLPTPVGATKLARVEAAYRLDAYELLLQHLGTSSQEIRLAATASAEERAALALRLGVPGDAAPGPAPVDLLRLETDAMTEGDLETLFGLVDTRRNPLVDGPVPKVQTWRAAQLRVVWAQQDRPPDAYQAEAAAPLTDVDLLSTVDPDVVTVDDMRAPSAGSPAFDLWLNRREWVDARLDAAIVTTEIATPDGPVDVPDVDASLAPMYAAVQYGSTSVVPWSGTQPDGFDDLSVQLAEPGEPGASAVAAVRADLRLARDAFVRLVSLADRGRAAVADPAASRLTAAEVGELAAILVAAQKEAFIQAWRIEEEALGLILGPRDFWPSLREPAPGAWPPAVEPGVPLVDPDIVDSDGLAEPTAGARARELWEARRVELTDVARAIADVHAASGFDAAMRHAVGHPAAGDPLVHDIDGLLAAVRSVDPGVVADGSANVEADLFMSVEEFLRIGAARAKEVAGKQVSASELSEVTTVLTGAAKRKRSHPVWVAEENDPATGVVYWSARKAQLAPWLGSFERRAGWRRALEGRSGSAIIDPDLIGPAELADPVVSDPAYARWKERRKWVKASVDALLALPRTTQSLHAAWEETVGATAAELAELGSGLRLGDDVTPRLAQLGVPVSAFDVLYGVQLLLASGSDVTDHEWASVASILTQVAKRRSSADWREEERAAGVVLGPDAFVVPKPPPLTFPPPEPTPPPEWRATVSEIRASRDTLQARIDQEAAMVDALVEAVSTTEEAVLPKLRDGLIVAGKFSGTGTAAKAAASDRLLVDMRAGGCQLTTRVAQAIETIQILLFATRVGRLQDAFGDVALSPGDDFDAEWAWIGGYGTWRSAMFVHLYPENIVAPSLRSFQTPAFRRVVSEGRSNRRFTPAQAQAAADDYRDYLLDVCSLDAQATCEATTHIRSRGKSGAQAESYRCLTYVFATSSASRKAYVSVFDPGGSPGYRQGFWEEVAGLTDVVRLVGAPTYEISEKRRSIYLFAVRRPAAADTLCFTRFDLETRQWDSEPTDLELPEDATEFSAVVRQGYRENARPHLAIQAPSGAIYTRRLAPDGAGWADGDWAPAVNHHIGRDFDRVEAMLDLGSGEFCLLASGGGEVHYRLFGARDDATWRHLSGGAYAGAFVDLADDTIYALSRDGSSTACVRLRPTTEVGDYLIKYFYELDEWLLSRTGLSFRQVLVPDNMPHGGLSVYEMFELETTDDIMAVLFPSYSRDMIGFRKIQVMAWLQGKIDGASSTMDDPHERDDDFGSWKLASELADKQLNGTLRQAVTDIVGLDPIKDEDGDYMWGGGGAVANERPPDQLDVIAVSPSGMHHMAAAYGSSAKHFDNRRYAFQGGTTIPGPHRCTIDLDDDGIVAIALENASRIVPVLSGPLDIEPARSGLPLQVRKTEIAAGFNANVGLARSVNAYLEEAWFFVPLQIGSQLQRAGYYREALDWYRSVYDYAAPSPAGRKIYYGLVREESLPIGFERPDDWLLDPLNPHLIAETRRRTYSRATILTIVRCLLDWADAEFTRDDAESVPRARELYTMALELLDTYDLKSTTGCSDVIGDVTIEVGDDVWSLPFAKLLDSLSHVADRAVMEKYVEQVVEIGGGPGPAEERFEKARSLVDEALQEQATPSILGDVIERGIAWRETARAAVVSVPSAAEAVRRVGAVAADDFARAVNVVTGVPVATLVQPKTSLPWLRDGGPTFVADSPVGVKPTEAVAVRRGNPMSKSHASALADIAAESPIVAVGVASSIDWGWVPAPRFDFCIPINPFIGAMRLRAELNLHKIRNCQNISGMRRQLQPYAAPTDTFSGMPTIGAGGQLVLPGAIRLAPTPYRFRALVDRAKQLASMAQQFEAAFLSAAEKRDAEAYSMLRARQDVQLTRAGVRLQDLRVREAESAVRLAELQQERAQLQVDHFTELLEEPISGLEMASLDLLVVVAKLQLAAATTSFVAAALPSSTGMTGVTYSPQGMTGSVASGLSSIAAAVSTGASVLATLANYQRRAEEWEFQRALAMHDVRIGAQGVRVAEDHVRVTGQERVIAQLQSDNAQATVEFLAEKFTNVDLYDWLSDQMSSVYSFFLQQATAVAQLAANQLAFERQEQPPPFVQADYWDAPSDGGSDGEAADRRGLAGSARLLRDVHELEQYAFHTDRRRLQLTKTVSLAQSSPIELLRLRTTGRTSWATTLEQFDREFPGHYLRLVHGVKASIVALVPPTHGIRATLSSTALSRVVIGGDVFQTVLVNQGLQSIALSAPYNATGLFELDAQSDMLRPFEGMGVEAVWELELPRAANPFDFSTIADVLLTIDYTALASPDYRHQIIQGMRPTTSGDRAFSLRTHFPDAWFDLHNPDQTAEPMVVTFRTARNDFPPNVDDLKIQHVTIYAVRRDGIGPELPIAGLHFTGDDAPGAVGGPATTVGGVASTLKGNAGSWMAIAGKRPFGTWRFALADTALVRDRFAKGTIDDIALVVTYAGRTPEWPA